MAILKINNVDVSNFVSGLQASRQTLVSDTSGRNASGTMSIDIINHKWTIAVTFRPLNTTEASTLYNLIEGYAGLEVAFINPYTNQETIAICYTGTPTADWYRYSSNLKLLKSSKLDFIEM